MARIPAALAHRLDRLARGAHRFHRFAHHPLCEEYEGEVVRVGRRARICRGCALVLIGLAAGTASGLEAFAPAAGLAAAAAALAAPRARKLATRFAPAFATAFAIGAGVRAASVPGALLAAGGLGALAALVFLYRRRAPDRTPCAACPERLQPAPCRGMVEIVRRERAYRRFSGRILDLAR